MKPGSYRAALRIVALIIGLADGVCHAQGSPPALLGPGLDQINLAGHVSELYDPTGELTFDDVRKPEIAAQFELSDRAVFTHGLSADTYWYRWSLRNPMDSGAGSSWILALGIPTLDFLDVHVQGVNGDVETFLVGDLRHNDPRLLDDPAFAIPLKILPGDEFTIHVRMQTTGRHQFWPRVWDENGFVARMTMHSRARGFFNGVFAVMILYNLLIFMMVRDRAYLYYVLFLLAFQATGAIINGAARRLGNDLFPAAPEVINGMAVFWPLLIPPLLLLFSAEFMQTRTHAPRLHRVLIGLTAILAGSLVLLPVVGFLLAVWLAVLSLVLALTLLACVVAYLAIKGVRAARYFLLAWGVLLVVMAVFMAETIGWISSNWVTVWMPPISVSITVALLSLALADRLNYERRERERLTRLKNFFAPQVAEAILEDGGGSLLAPKRREVTVVFTDLRGFTALAAQSEPEDVIRVLREYHEVVVETTSRHGGNVEHIAGDGVMIYFNAPIEISEPEVRAVRLVFELRERFEVLREVWRKRGHEVGVGIGIACGFATVGAVGARGRMDYSCIGTVTNVAARLCARARHGQILAPELFVNRVEPLVAIEPLGAQKLKGLPRRVAVFSLQRV